MSEHLAQKPNLHKKNKLCNITASGLHQEVRYGSIAVGCVCTTYVTGCIVKPIQQFPQPENRVLWKIPRSVCSQLRQSTPP